MQRADAEIIAFSGHVLRVIRSFEICAGGGLENRTISSKKSGYGSPMDRIGLPSHKVPEVDLGDHVDRIRNACSGYVAVHLCFWIPSFDHNAGQCDFMRFG